MIETRNLSQYAELHRTRAYGATGRNKLKLIEPWIQIARPRSMLDYGAGQSRMIDEIRSIGLKVRDRYDPAIAEISTHKQIHYDLVSCIDVLEHLDEQEVSAIVADIAKLGANAVFVVDTKVAGTILPNGENAHATVRPGSWWLSKIRDYYPDAELIEAERGRAIIKSWTSGSTGRLAYLLLRHVVRPVLPRR